MADIQIPVTSPANIPTPPAGQVTLFLDTTNNNILSYMDENRDVHPYYGENQNLAECCACEIAKEMTEKVSCALAKGIITMTEYNTFVAAGLTINAIETDNGNGTKSCTVNVSTFQGNIPVQSVTITGDSDVTDGGQTQLTATVSPVNATNQALIWISSDPSVATVDANGLVSGLVLGTVTIYVYTVDGNYSDSHVMNVVVP
jgi:hypothetical protein